MAPLPVERWSDLLHTALGAGDGPFRRATVVADTDSTQDEARRLGAAPGDVVVAARQRAGRGRLGRSWADTGDDGIAVTFVTAASSPPRLAVACAVAAARAAESLLGRRVGIKWPNDVVVERRKLAGVLVEQSGGAALIGIGMNVRQRSWPQELAGRAVSLAELGCAADRIEAIVALVASMNDSLRLDDATLAGDFSARDAMSGRSATFRSGGRTVTGTVLNVDPMRGLRVRTPEGEVYLAAATTTVVGAEEERLREPFSRPAEQR